MDWSLANDYGHSPVESYINSYLIFIHLFIIFNVNTKTNLIAAGVDCPHSAIQPRHLSQVLSAEGI